MCHSVYSMTLFDLKWPKAPRLAPSDYVQGLLVPNRYIPHWNLFDLWNFTPKIHSSNRSHFHVKVCVALETSAFTLTSITKEATIFLVLKVPFHE